MRSKFNQLPKTRFQIEWWFDCQNRLFYNYHYIPKQSIFILFYIIFHKCKIIRFCSWKKDFVTFHTVTLSALDSTDFLGLWCPKNQKVHFFFRFWKNMEPSEIKFRRAPCFLFFQNLIKNALFGFFMPEPQESSTKTHIVKSQNSCFCDQNCDFLHEIT